MSLDRSVKVIPPEAGRYFARQPLMKRLSGLLRSPGKIWISSPGGAGKTALVRNLLAGDPRPLFWYQVDSEDQDPANLFHYLAQSVVGEAPGQAPLPRLEPEYLDNLEIFCRNFCKAMFSRIATPCVLVFDDLQEGPGEPLFGPFLSALMAELPVSSSLLIVSREEPYQRFARDRMNHTLAHLNWEDLRLSADETRRFLNWSRRKRLSQQLSDHAYQLTQGWLAGLLLYLDSPSIGQWPQQNSLECTELLFDYFAEEIFTRIDSVNREFLLLCSLLPSINLTMAEQFTGRVDAGEVLDGLLRDNLFTYRIATRPEVYRFHPLFQQFLQSKADQILSREQCALLRQQAAGLFIDAGQSESAVELLIETRAWSTLIEIISSQAEALLQQGRSKTLLQWLEALPPRFLEQDPWRCYWRGVCLLGINPSLAMETLTRAFELFDDKGDGAGSMLSWGMVVNAIVIAWDDYTILDNWVDRFDRLLERYQDYPSLAIESLMVQGIFKSLAWRHPQREDLPSWAQRLHRLVTTSSDSDYRLLAGSNLVLYHLISGSIATAESLVDVLNSDLHSSAVSPLKKLVWLATRGALEWVLHDRAGCMETMEEGQAIIESSGVHVLDIRLYAQGITLGLTTGDLVLARGLFDELPAKPILTSLDHALHALLQAELSLLQGDTAKAIALAETATKRATDGGNLVIRAMSLCVFAMALYQDGRLERAKDVLDVGLGLTVGMKYFRCSLLLQAAHIALEKGELKSARSLLREGFGLAAGEGYLNFLPWRDDMMVRLCRQALGAGIEVDYVTRLVDVRKLNRLKLTTVSLSPKEKETLGWVQEGKTTWEIARILGVSEATVKFHVGNVLRKLGASSRTQAVAIALKAGLLSE